MAVYREGFHALKKIQTNSKQLFNDAADYGAPCNKGDEIWNAAIALAAYTDKSSRTESRYATGQSCSCDVELFDEWAFSDRRKTEKEATENYTLCYVGCKQKITVNGKKYDGYVYVHQM